MHHQTQVSLTQELLAHIAAGTTALADGLFENPVDIYTCADRASREKDALFKRYPISMGLSCTLPGPNTYRADDLAGVPVLLTRDSNGVAHAFLNVCRHRGARIAEGSGDCGAAMTCPYHGWGYRSDGTLAGIPDRRNFHGLDVEREALTPLPMVERDGMLWVGLTPGTALDLDAHLGNLNGELASYGFGNYHYYESRVLRHQMNWKIAIDTFLEPYHFAVLHKTTVNPIFLPNLCLVHEFGLNLREILPRRSIETLRAKAEDDWDLVYHCALVYVLFPNTVVVMQADHVELWRIFPDGDRTDACVMTLEFYIPEPVQSDAARRHWDANMELVLRTVQTEDFPTGEGIQKGLGAGAQAAVVYGRNEPALQSYHRSVRQAMAAA